MLSPRRHLSVDELSHRSSTGLALRRGEIKISEPIPSSYMHNRLEMDDGHEVYQAVDRAVQSGTWPRGSAATTMAGRSDPLSHVARASTFHDGTSQPTKSAMPLAPSKSTVSMQRRNTGLKASLKRMFGSKRESTDELEGLQPHRSITRGSNSRPTTNAISPLQQHPYDAPAVTAIRSASQHNLLAHDRHCAVYGDPSDVEKRRNTIPDLLMILNDTPTSTQRNVVASASKEVEDAIAAGNAVEDRLSRRSKSAGALTELLRTSQARLPSADRAEKIAEWRDSIASTSKPHTRRAETEPETEVAIDDSISRRESLEPSRTIPLPSTEAVQEFNFGLIRSNIAPQAGTVEERMNTLEVKMADFEYAMVKMQGSNTVKPNIARPETGTKQKTKTPIQAVRQVDGEDGMPSLSSSCSTRDFSFTSSPRDGRRKLSGKEEVEQASVVRAAVRAQHARRPSSIRSRNPSPILAAQDNKQYNELIKMITEERQARSELELRIVAMQRQLDDLATPIPVFIKPVNQLAPSPELTSHRPLHRSPALQPQYPFQIETSRFSMNETDTDADETEDGYNEHFMTPQADAFRFEHMNRAPVGMI